MYRKYRDGVFTGFYVSGYVSEGHFMYRKMTSMYRKIYQNRLVF